MKLIHWIKSLSVTFILVFSLAILVPIKVSADIPPQPEEFYGNVSINDVPAPTGSIITAKINNVVRGSITTTANGAYGGSATFAARLVVSGIQTDIGQSIYFYINGQIAGQTQVFTPGQSQNLDLSSYKYPLSVSDIQIQKALTYLKQAQQPDGDIGGYVTSAWAVMAISAAGQNPHNWTVGNNSIISYLATNASANLDTNKATDWERSILAIVATGENPYSFGGINYVSKLLSFYDGQQMGDPTLLNDDVWGILALKAIGQGQQMIPNMVTFLKNHQNSDGGWSFAVGGTSDADDTAATVAALLDAGESPSSADIASAVSYLKSQQQSNGGFTSEGNTNSGVDSWVIRAIRGLGQSPTGSDWQQGSNNPVSFLLSLQNANGSFKWTPTQQTNPQWMTAYAILALLGAPWPEDTTPPVISGLSPVPDSEISSTSTVIKASYSDNISGINQNSVKLYLDGLDVTSSASISTSVISYNASGLGTGTHTVKVTVSDQAGNSASQTWTFQIAIPASSSTGSSGGGGGGGGSISITNPTPTPTPTPSSLPPGATNVANIVDASGIFNQGITIQSQDDRCTLTIANGVKGLTSNSQALTRLTVSTMTDPPAPPAQSSIIGPVYDFGPDGASFNPPITMTYDYNTSDLPPGVSENSLTLGYWDSVSSKWVALPSTVDAQAKTITAPVSHFCAFTAIVRTRPANFDVSNLSISPTQAGLNSNINISALVSNTGDINGTYNADLKVDGSSIQTEAVALEGGQRKSLNFSIPGNAAGTHTVSIGSQVGTYTIKSTQSTGNLVIKSLTLSSPQVSSGSKVIVTASVDNPGISPVTDDLILKINNRPSQTKTVSLAGDSNENINFSVSENVAGTYSASIGNLYVPFTVEASPEATSATSTGGTVPVTWFLIVGAILAALVIGLLIVLLIRKRA